MAALSPPEPRLPRPQIPQNPRPLPPRVYASGPLHPASCPPHSRWTLPFYTGQSWPPDSRQPSSSWRIFSRRSRHRRRRRRRSKSICCNRRSPPPRRPSSSRTALRRPRGGPILSSASFSFVLRDCPSPSPQRFARTATGSTVGTGTVCLRWRRHRSPR